MDDEIIINDIFKKGYEFNIPLVTSTVMLERVNNGNID